MKEKTLITLLSILITLTLFVAVFHGYFFVGQVEETNTDIHQNYLDEYYQNSVRPG